MDKDVNDDDVNSGVFTQVRGRRKKPKRLVQGKVKLKVQRPPRCTFSLHRDWDRWLRDFSRM